MRKHTIPTLALLAMFSTSATLTAEITLTILRDTAHSLSNNLFTGAEKSVIDALSPDGFSPAQCRVFYVSDPASGKSCLIDTGRGGTKLPAEMAAAGITPESIGAILLTHTHGDHTGGLLAPDGSTAAFSNATIYVNAPELEFWRKTRPDNLAAVEKVYKARPCADAKMAAASVTDEKVCSEIGRCVPPLAIFAC